MPIHQPLPNAARDNLASTDVVLPIHQSEIFVFVPHSTAGAQGGASAGMIGALVGAIVDAEVDRERTTKAEAAVTPLRNAMVDYNFDSAFESELKTGLAQVAWLHPGNYSVARDISDDNLAKALAASHAAAVLFVGTEYTVSNGGDVLTVTLQVSLMPNNDALRALRTKKDDQKPMALTNAIYRNRFVFEARVSNTGDRDRNIAAWSANNGSLTRAALTMAAKKLVPLMVEDIQRAEGDVAPPDNAAQAPVSVPSEAANCQFAASGAQCGNSAMLETHDEDGQVYRFKDGSMKYFKTGQFQS